MLFRGADKSFGEKAVEGLTVEKRDGVKSHEDIMAMFQELEELERRLRDRDKPLVPEIPAEVIAPAPESAPQPRPKRVSVPRFSRSKKKAQDLPRKKPSFSRRKKQHTPGEMVVHPVRPTFSLRLDDEGNLLGFDQPKPKPPKSERGLFHRKKAATAGADQQQSTGRFAKLRSVVSRRKSGVQSGGSKLSGVLGKLKLRRGSKD